MTAYSKSQSASSLDTIARKTKGAQSNPNDIINNSAIPQKEEHVECAKVNVQYESVPATAQFPTSKSCPPNDRNLIITRYKQSNAPFVDESTSRPNQGMGGNSFSDILKTGRVVSPRRLDIQTSEFCIRWTRCSATNVFNVSIYCALVISKSS